LRALGRFSRLGDPRKMAAAVDAFPGLPANTAFS